MKNRRIIFYINQNLNLNFEAMMLKQMQDTGFLNAKEKLIFVRYEGPTHIVTID